MKGDKTISGFSKLSKIGKIKWIVDHFFTDPEAVMKELKSYWLDDEEQQKILDGFSENTISNFYMPYGVAPNFVINEKTYVVPMVIEESSVVAAASSAAKYWMTRGGFKATVLGMEKIGQVHFYWSGRKEVLFRYVDSLKAFLTESAADITESMEQRGGGINSIELLHFDQEPDYYQLRGFFNTCDSMGANFINTVLERWAAVLPDWFINHPEFHNGEHDVKIIMSILSNYTPKCLVRAEVSCPVKDLGTFNDIGSPELADRFYKAVRIAHIDPYRATTHNKGIYNGIDAVALATGNDFRAIEACGHTYACRNGQYRSLSDCSVEDGYFKFWLEVPLALGTIGGLTKLHPVARRSLELLGNPDAEELMKIAATTGLAQNFAALRSLVTTGIQKGHMKLHLKNILTHLGADEEQEAAAIKHFKNHTVSYKAVRTFLGIPADHHA